MRTVFRRGGAALAAVGLTIGLAACGGGGDSGSSSKGYVPPKGASTQTIEITAKNFSFTPDTITVPAGISTIKLDVAQGQHDLVFDGAYSGFQVEANDGGSDSQKIDLKPGKYTFYCNFTGHRAAGMEGTLTVK